jgi:dUTPase
MVTLPPILEYVRLDPHARPPERYDDHAIGWDVFAFLLTESGRATSRAIQTQGITEIPTGIKLRPPEGYYVQISSRLSLARLGIFVANAPALIPTGFDSELTILLVNTSYKAQYVAHEHRIAHITLHPILTFRVRELQAPEHPQDVHPRPGQGHH